MRYGDAVYGTVEIAQPVLRELMASRALGRLKGILQHGITALLGITPAFSRFEHSVGAMLLTRRLGASIEEQVAALLHDVGHAAFSHVIDFVFDDADRQSYHEKKKEPVMAASDIPEILRRHGMDWRAFVDEDKFTLLEQASPALCADRLDYFLRDLEFFGLASDGETRAMVESLVVSQGRIAVRDAESARWLAYSYIEADRASWSSFREVGLYQLTAEAIKAARRLGLIAEADLWESDQTLWSKLRAADHPEVRRLVDLISPGTRFTWDSERPAFRVATKVRSIDPPVAAGETATPLSVLDPAFGRYRDNYLAGKQGLWPMSVVRAPA